MTTYAELKAQAEKLMAQAEELKREERNGIISEIKAKITEFGLTARDLGLLEGGRPRASKAFAKAAVAPKYRGPNGELWSGRGRMPIWLSSAIEAGESKDSFII